MQPLILDLASNFLLLNGKDFLEPSFRLEESFEKSDLPWRQNSR